MTGVQTCALPISYHKKSIEEREEWTKDGERIVRVTGWRWGEWTVTTNDGNPPNFEFSRVPGGNDAKDSIDINCCSGSNIEEVEMVETTDGCYADIEFPEDMDEAEQERLTELWDEEFYEGWEGEDWYQSDTEMWIWGPIEITNDKGYSRIIIADEDGNVTDFEE